MRRSRVEAAESRKKVVRAAAALLRDRGVDGVNVADVMAAAGMTPGGFYKHFEDKDALVAEAFDTASDESFHTLCAVGEKAAKGKNFEAIVSAYLSQEHWANPAHGCPLAATATDAARQGKGFRLAFDACLERMCDLMVEAAARDRRPMKRQDALATVALLVGTVALARATKDPKAASDLLRAARARLIR
jgi:TetR/AcrR family transcriptional repressor of nem operon